MIAFFSAGDYCTPRMIERAVFGPDISDDAFLLLPGKECFDLDIDSQFGSDYEKNHSNPGLGIRESKSGYKRNNSSYTSEEQEALSDLEF